MLIIQTGISQGKSSVSSLRRKNTIVWKGNPCARIRVHGYRRDTHSTRGYTEGGTELIITKPRVVKV